MSDAIKIRPAVVGDLESIFSIYNHEVEHEVSTFDTQPRVLGRDDGWLTERPERYPVLVGELNDALAGWGSLSQWSPRGAYARTAEVSVYVDRPLRGSGYGKQLLAALIEIAPETGAGVLLARIAGANPTSIALHRSLGFQTIGIQKRAGQKFNQILDIALMDRHLDQG